MDEAVVGKFVRNVERWSSIHTLLQPRALHLRAEMACGKDATQVIAYLFLADFRLLDCSTWPLQKPRNLDFSMLVPSSTKGLSFLAILEMP